MTMPNFLVIGAAKAGTTALHHYLNQHPDIYMSHPKELKFFAFEGQRPDYRGPGEEMGISMITSIEDYRACFAAGKDYRARGESSPQYIYFSRAAERIRHYVPHVKLIAVLRHPVDRAYSHYLMVKREGREPFSFAEALAAEDQRVSNRWGHHWHYRRRGFYAAQLSPYFDLMSREQIRIYLYEDLLTEPLGVVQDIFQFLNVADTFVPDMSIRHNESRIPRSSLLNRYLTEPHPTKELCESLVPFKLSPRIGERLRRLNLLKRTLPDNLRRQLIDVYREDIIELQGMLQRDLSHWLK